MAGIPECLESMQPGRPGGAAARGDLALSGRPGRKSSEDKQPLGRPDSNAKPRLLILLPQPTAASDWSIRVMSLSRLLQNVAATLPPVAALGVLRRTSDGKPVTPDVRRPMGWVEA